MSYKHITPDQRNELSALKRTKIKQKEIAQILGKNRTTIYRELKRNKNKDGKYDARIAKQKTKERRIKSYDNGSTFASHQETERKTKIDIYFAYPYHSWERGCNENCNGLLRQFFSKKSSFADISQKDIDKAYRLINNRPRKRLNYSTPYEVFYEK